MHFPSKFCLADSSGAGQGHRAVTWEVTRAHGGRTWHFHGLPKITFQEAKTLGSLRKWGGLNVGHKGVHKEVTGQMLPPKLPKAHNQGRPEKVRGLVIE